MKLKIIIISALVMYVAESNAQWYNTIDQQSQNAEMRRQQQQNIRDFNNAQMQQQFLINQQRQAEEQRQQFLRQNENGRYHYQYQNRFGR